MLPAMPEGVNVILTLALLGTTLADPTTKADYLAKTNPDHLTRLGIGRDENGALGVIFDNVNGPMRDGYTEVMSLTTFNDGSMLVMLQKPTHNLGEVSTDEIDQLGQTIYDIFGPNAEVKFSALGDPELDDQIVTGFLDQKGGKYEMVDASAKLQGFTVKDGLAVIYFDGKMALIVVDQLLQNLRDDTKAIDDGAIATVDDVGDGAKMARFSAIEIEGDSIPAWTYVQKAADGKLQKFFLDKDDLHVVAVKEFEGADYVTTSIDGKHLIMVARRVQDADETYKVTRRPIDAAIEQATSPQA